MGQRQFDDLVRDAKRGDAEALSGLCTRLYPRMLKYMRYRVDAASAEDLTADVFLRVLRHIRSQKGSFTAWLFKIAANVVADYARTKAMRKESPLNEEGVMAVRTIHPPSEDSDRRIDMQDAITQLTDEQRELISYKFVLGFSNSEIAEVTGRKLGAIRALQFRAVTVLREILSGDSEGESDDA